MFDVKRIEKELYNGLIIIKKDKCNIKLNAPTHIRKQA